MKKALLLLPEGWELEEVWVCVDKFVNEPHLLDKEALEIAPNKELSLPGSVLVPNEGVKFAKAKIKRYPEDL